MDVLRAIQDHRRVCVVAGHGVGKTRLAATAALHWLYCRPRSIVLCMSPSSSQLQLVLWQEIRMLFANSRIPLPGRIINGANPRIEVAERWFLAGRSADTDPERLAGVHGGDVLCILDEASWPGYDQAIDTLDGLNASRYLLIGNPISSSSEFYRIVQRADGVSTVVLNISSLESPHAQLERSPVGLADKGYLDSMLVEHGADSPIYGVRVLGQFQADDQHTLIPSSWMGRCSQKPPESAQPSERTMAVDLSKGTGRGDDTVILVRDDDQVLAMDWSASYSYPEGVVQRVVDMATQYQVKPHRIVYDSGGLGEAFGYVLKQHGLHGCVPYVGGAKGDKRATNARGSAAMNLKDRLDPSRNAKPFHIPPAYLSILAPQIRELRYEIALKDQVKVEPKEAMRARLGRSPDQMDALCQSFAIVKRPIAAY